MKLGMTVKIPHQVRRRSCAFGLRTNRVPGKASCNRAGFFRLRNSTGFVRRGSLPATKMPQHGRFDDWKHEPRSCLALVLLLDQFPRNMFRGTARAFATDAKARELTHHAVSSGFDRKLSPIMRMFLYLPLEHSENLNDQLESVRLTSALVSENPDYPEILQYAEAASGSIPAIWKVPGRNHALGRESTQEEMNFLKDQKWR